MSILQNFTISFTTFDFAGIFTRLEFEKSSDSWTMILGKLMMIKF